MLFFFAEANIFGEISKCREAINSKNWSVANAIAQSIAAKGKRLIEVGTALLESAAHDPTKKTAIQNGLDNLDKGL